MAADILLQSMSNPRRFNDHPVSNRWTSTYGKPPVAAGKWTPSAVQPWRRGTWPSVLFAHTPRTAPRSPPRTWWIICHVLRRSRRAAHTLSSAEARAAPWWCSCCRYPELQPHNRRRNDVRRLFTCTNNWGKNTYCRHYNKSEAKYTKKWNMPYVNRIWYSVHQVIATMLFKLL